MLYGIGRLFKGRGEIIDIRIVAAYSMIPGFLKLPFILYYGLMIKTNTLTGVEYWINHAFYIAISIWTVKILIQGLVKFNKYSLFKAFLNISPLLLIDILSYLNAFVKFH